MKIVRLTAALACALTIAGGTAVAHAQCGAYAQPKHRGFASGTSSGVTATVTIPAWDIPTDVCFATLTWYGNGICNGNANPYACCTGVGAGNCDTVSSVPAGWTLVTTAYSGLSATINQKTYWATGLSAGNTAIW